MNFEFSDTIGGKIQSYDATTRSGVIQSFAGDNVAFKLSANIYARLLRNLDEPYRDCTGQLDKLLREGQPAFMYGIYYPDASGTNFEASYIDFPGRKPNEMRFEEADWWVNQARSIADFYIRRSSRTAKLITGSIGHA